MLEQTENRSETPEQVCHRWARHLGGPVMLTDVGAQRNDNDNRKGSRKLEEEKSLGMRGVDKAPGKIPDAAVHVTQMADQTEKRG